MATISPLVGKPAPPSVLANVTMLIRAYYDRHPDPSMPAQRVGFGTSGHRGSSLDRAFNEHHIVAITQAICLHRKHEGIDGPLFIGFDTHALSEPAFVTALEVLAANGVDVMVDARGRDMPTPVVSHAILGYNRSRRSGLADGIVITPSHNPPEYGGFKYDPPHGGPADTHVTRWIEERANAFLADRLHGVARMPFDRARTAPTTHSHEYRDAYVAELASVVDLDAIRASGLRIGVDPLGGASVDCWHAIAERYDLDLTVVNDVVDPTFRFMTVDWDGKIRMDPSSPYAMARLVGLKDGFDVACASDTDADRHGVLSRSAGLLEPNHYLSVAIDYLFRNRPRWSGAVAVGKTVVSSSMIDRVAARLGRPLVEVPIGFKPGPPHARSGQVRAGVRRRPRRVRARRCLRRRAGGDRDRVRQRAEPCRGGARGAAGLGHRLARRLDAVVGAVHGQSQEYRDGVLPPAVTARLAVEQGSTLGWERYVGPRGHMIGMKTFGASAPLKELQKKFGFEPERVTEVAKALVRAR